MSKGWEGSALSVVDLLFAAPEERLILRCLSRYPKLTLAELAGQVALPLPQLQMQVEQLVKRGEVVEQLRQGQRTFRLRLASLSQRVRNMPVAAQQLFHATPTALLDEMPLTRQLDDQARADLLDNAQMRPVLADEVCLWQGQMVESVYLLHSGMLRQRRMRSVTAEEVVRYLQPGQWVGLSEFFARRSSNTTTTGVVPSQLYVWDRTFFTNFIMRHPAFANGLCELLGTSWQECLEGQQRGHSQLWVVEGSAPAVGSSAVAHSLAELGQRGGSGFARVLFWDVAGDGPLRRTDLPRLRITRGLPRADFPLSAQLDMLLGKWQRLYDLVICDAGPLAASSSGENAGQLLRQRATCLITVTDDPNPQEATTAPLNSTQLRLVVLNQARDAATGAHIALALPHDPVAVKEAAARGRSVALGAAGSLLAQGLVELYRRLSLTHTVGIFIPSTVDVDQPIDNEVQVQRALSFLGERFGGATSSAAEGVWQSDQKQLVTERITVVRAFVTRYDLDKHLDEVIAFAIELKQEMLQEAVALDVDHHLVLV